MIFDHRNLCQSVLKRPFPDERVATAITGKILNESLQNSLKECRYHKLKTRTIISPHREDNLALICSHINSVILIVSFLQIEVVIRLRMLQ